MHERMLMVIWVKFDEKRFKVKCDNEVKGLLKPKLWVLKWIKEKVLWATPNDILKCKAILNYML